jgi:hypothetical protein
MGNRNFPVISIGASRGIRKLVDGDVGINVSEFLTEWLDPTGGATITKTSGTVMSIVGGDYTEHFTDGRKVKITESSGGPTYATCDGTPTFGAGNTAVTLKWFSGPDNPTEIPADLDAVFLHAGGGEPKFVYIVVTPGTGAGNIVFVTPTNGAGGLATPAQGFPLWADRPYGVILNVHGHSRLAFNRVAADDGSYVYVYPLEDF